MRTHEVGAQLPSYRNRESTERLVAKSNQGPSGRGAASGERETEVHSRLSTRSLLFPPVPQSKMIESTYRTLVAWQRSVELAIYVYEVTKRFPAYERFCLTQQLRRAAVSVPSNIAEGRARGSRRDYRRFLLQARGSL